MSIFYERTFQVGADSTDLFGCCRTSAIQSMLQEAASDHADRLSLSYETMRSLFGGAFILVRFGLRLFRPLRHREAITVRTYPFPPEGAAFIREFDILADGVMVGEAVSHWAVVEFATGKIVRPKTVLQHFHFESPEKKRDWPLLKLAPAGELAEAPSYLVRYSDIDLNGHMGNPRYVDLACDSICLESLPPSYISSLQIGYLTECRAGELLSLGTFGEGAERFVRGTGPDGKLRFDAFFTLSELT